MSLPRLRLLSPRRPASGAVIALALLSAPAAADTLSGEPSSGLALPAAPLAGDADGRTVVTNPAGLIFVDRAELALALGVEDAAVSAAGGGTGAYLAFAGGGGTSPFPRFGFGLATEWLRPAHDVVTPDPGTPFRFTMSNAVALGRHFGYGVAWHHTFDDGGLDGLDTYDLGLSARAGNHLAIGGVVRDVTAPRVNGLKLERRYELEAVMRPRGTNVLEVALGGRIAETTRDKDGWVRATARIARGLFAHAALESRATHRTDDLGMVTDGRELRATLGLEVSLGGVGATALATGVRDDRGARKPLGGQLLLRASAAGPASITGRGDHVERVEVSGELGLRETTALVRRLRAIRDDKTAIGVLVELEHLAGGPAVLQEVRDELVALRRAGKKVFAHALTASQRDYFVASAADKVFLDPAGDLELIGLHSTAEYYRGTLDLLGIVPQYEKIAEYKSAPEHELLTGPSEPAAKMRTELVDSIWNQWVAQVADGRRLKPDELRAIIDKGPYTAGDLAVEKRLVDAIVTPDKVDDLVRAELGRKKLPIERPAAERSEKWQHPRVAVIYIDGDIVEGKSRGPLPIPVPLVGGAMAGSDTLVAAIEAARKDDSIGAIVLRIDSPGGTVLASELISRAVFKTRGVKPILCSVADVAASGAYFIAAGCDRIYAEPMSITGSIGIYAGKRDVSGLVGKLGITFDSIKRGAHADLYSGLRQWTDEERKVVYEKMSYSYGRFIGAVAEGRGLAKDRVDALGRGRVYTGHQAQPIKLVDEHGGLNAALDEAARRMKLSPSTRIELVELPRKEGSLLGPLGALAGARSGKATLEEIGRAIAPVVEPLIRSIPPSLLHAPRALQARMPFEIHWD